MFVTEQDALRRLNSSQNLSRAEVRSSVVQFVEKKTAGGNNGHMNDFQRELLGTLKRTSGQTCEEVAQAFGTTKQQVSYCETGVVGGKKVDEALRQRIDENTGVVRDVAITKLMETLGLLTDEKLKKEGAKGLASVARDLSSVAERMSPRSGDNVNNGVQFIVHVPHQKREESYDVIEVTAS